MENDYIKQLIPEVKKLIGEVAREVFTKSSKDFREKLQYENKARREELEFATNLREEKFEKERKEREDLLEKEILKHEAKLVRERNEHEAKLERERNEHEAKLERERKEYEAKLERERNEHDAKLEKERKEREELLEAKHAKEKKDHEEKLEKEMKVFKKQMKELSWQIGGIGNSNRSNAEEFFFRSFEKSMSIEDLSFDYITANMNRYKKKSNLQGQYDIVLNNCDTTLVVEVKYKLTPEYVEHFYRKSLPKFKRLFPEFADHKLYGAVASFSDQDNARQLATQYGLFVLGQSGQSLKVLNKKACQI
jgi:flagellar biosynthesis GTPase FlhF